MELARIVDMEVTTDKWNQVIPKIKKQAKLESDTSVRVKRSLMNFPCQGIHY